MTTLDPQLAEVTRCLIALSSAQGTPQFVSLPCWSDGEALWLARTGADPVAQALTSTPDCAVWMGGAGQAAGLEATGLARVFGVGDPLGLLIHGPVVAVAMAALAAHHPREVTSAWLPLRPPVAMRLALSELRTAEPPPAGLGIAPALPEVVPADIRRHLSGRRDVIVAAERASGLRVERAIWSAGFALDGDLPVAPGASIVVAVEDGAVGAALSGELDARGALRPAQASWWSGPRSGSAPLPPPPRGAVTLPD